MIGPQLITWYEDNKRDLPWRHTSDPYRIWLSEIILQQTRVDQGMAYYEKFVHHYPNVHLLAAASEDEILKHWQGLGYYSRARNLHTAAKYISTEWHGKFPGDHAQIRQLKGVGDYTAAAIASFAFALPFAVVDGNVYRVLSRIFGMDIPIDSTQGKKAFAALAQEQLDTKQPGSYNQAIMEFGALHCLPNQPKCTTCPLSDKCIAYRKNSQSELPVKAKKTQQRDRFFHYVVIKQAENTFLRKRSDKGIWQNLFEFPLVESATLVDEQQLLDSEDWQALLGTENYTIVQFSELHKHILSHQKIHARFVEVTINSPFNPIQKEWLKVPLSELHQYAIPRLIDRYLEESDFL